MENMNSAFGVTGSSGYNTNTNVQRKQRYIFAWIATFILVPFILPIGFYIAWFICQLVFSNFLFGSSSSALDYGTVEILAFYIPAGLSLALLALFWFLYARRKLKSGGESAAAKLALPILAAFVYYMTVWVILNSLFGYSLLGHTSSQVFNYLTAPHYSLNIVLAVGGDHGFFPLVVLVTMAVALLSVFVPILIKKVKVRLDKKVLVCTALSVVLLGVAVFQFYDRANIFMVDSEGYSSGSTEINTNSYMPFFENNKLERLDESASISIDNDYPRLDGATAALPVYGAMVQEIYKGLDMETIRQYVDCLGTSYAYERLIMGETDMLFGAEPSRQQLQMAKDWGVELKLTPVAKEAFVFIVNENNPVDSLTVEQIQDIYQKNITNWSELGGKHEGIKAFQRPENSGSQTIMLSAVMQGKNMVEPLREERIGGMGGMLSEVVQYRNYSAAIGYSFRYYTTSINPKAKIKMLAINGVEPSVENIQDGSYPFTIETYAVTAEVTDAVVFAEQAEAYAAEQGYTDGGASVNGYSGTSADADNYGNPSADADNYSNPSADADNYGSTNAGTEGLDGGAASADNEARRANAQKLLDWILSEQGQAFIEKCGYVRLSNHI